MEFKTLNISHPILKVIKEIGYQEATPIQEKAIPEALLGKDILGCAQTGTGKTAAFAIPTLQLLSQKGSYGIRALILTPTRELAIQIHDNFKTYGKYLSLKSAVIFGGVSQKPQEVVLNKGVDILIATPGRLLDLMNQGIIDISTLEIFILDEADRMLDMGFFHDVKKVIAKIPKKKQTLLFSATMPKDIQVLASSLLHDPTYIEVAPVSSTVDTIAQSLYYVDKPNKKRLLVDIIKKQNIDTALVFTRTKVNADRVAKYLNREGIKASAIHGDKSQGARQNALTAFKNNKIKVLVATDIAARGIDIQELKYVFNYEIPGDSESYVHRIGRTGRAGYSGTSISFSDINEVEYVKSIEKLIAKKIPVIEEHAFPMENLVPVTPKKPSFNKPSKKAVPKKEKQTISKKLNPKKNTIKNTFNRKKVATKRSK